MSEEMSSGAEGLGEVDVSAEGGVEEVSQAEGSVIEGAGEAVQENIEVLAEQVKDAIEEGATKKEVQSLIKEFELKVNGKQVKAKIDLGDEEAVKRELQKAYAFNDVSQENANIKKALNARIQEWKANPASLFEALELDATEFSASHLDKLIEEERKSPEQKETEARAKRETELESRIREYEEREARFKQAIQEQEDKRQQESLRNSLIEEIDGAITKSSFLKPSAEMRQELADLMYYYQEQHPDREITAEMVVPVLEKQVREKTQRNMGILGDDKLLEMLGPEKIAQLAAKIKQASQAAKVEPKKAPPVLPSQSKVASVEPVQKAAQTVKKRSFEDILRQR